jgi:myosin heavy subunit
MATLGACHAFYVRCIKPNGIQQPVTFDVDLVMAQLRYTGKKEKAKEEKKANAEEKKRAYLVCFRYA